MKVVSLLFLGDAGHQGVSMGKKRMQFFGVQLKKEMNILGIEKFILGIVMLLDLIITIGMDFL